MKKIVFLFVCLFITDAVVAQDDYNKYIDAATKGDTAAQYKIGEYYKNKKNYEQAALWYEKAANQGHAEAQKSLANIYTSSESIKDYSQALYWMLKAANQGNFMAISLLHLYYESGMGVPVNNTLAVYWAQKAIEKGDDFSYLSLSVYYLNGLGVPQDYKKATYYCNLAIEKGKAFVKRSGEMLLKTIAEDEEKERTTNKKNIRNQDIKNYNKFIESAEKGDPEAQFIIGNTFVNINGTLGLEWYTKAAQQGHVKAQSKVGIAHAIADGTTRDYQKAAYWLKKAAENGDADAQKHLGYCYYYGRGVTKDIQTANLWFDKAKKQGAKIDDLLSVNNLDNFTVYNSYIFPQQNEVLTAIKTNAKNDPSKNDIAQIPPTENKPATTPKKTVPAKTTPKSNKQQSQQPQQTQNPPQQEGTVGIDVVDKDIPTVGRVNRNTFAIIIANEDYQKEAKVDYAKNDGETFKNYCHKTLGLPEKNVHYVANATLNNLIGELDWLQQVCDAFGGNASVIFYYAGHGIPDEASGASYLMPIDGNSRLLRTCFSINELYETLGRMPAKKVTVLMDACFSGAKRNGGMLAAARGVAIKAKPSAPKGNMIVLTAAQGEETAYKYEEAKHGLFTYFLLKKLKESKGNVTMGELSNYVKEQVKRYSIVENGKSQTPSVMTSDNLKTTWESMKIE